MIIFIPRAPQSREPLTNPPSSADQILPASVEIRGRNEESIGWWIWPVVSLDGRMVTCCMS